MISHVSLGVRDLATSGRFYDAVLAALGYPQVAGTKPTELAYGPSGAALFWLYETGAEGTLASPGTHIAFRAGTTEDLHDAASAAEQHGAVFTRNPGPHPDLAPNYYGAILLDPDGHKLELVVEGNLSGRPPSQARK